MAGIKQPIQDVLQQLATIQVQNQDAQIVSLYTRIFNNQTNWVKQAKEVAQPLPAAYVEVIKPATYERIGNGVSDSDIVFRIHIVHWFTDAQDGTFDQDLLIFDLRDQVIACLSDYRPTACGNMYLTSEEPNYEHDDIYEYLIDFTCNFTDSKGSKYDIGRGLYVNSTPPIDLVLNIEIEQPVVSNAWVDSNTWNDSLTWND